MSFGNTSSESNLVTKVDPNVLHSEHTRDDKRILSPLYFGLQGNESPFKAMHLAHLCSSFLIPLKYTHAKKKKATLSVVKGSFDLHSNLGVTYWPTLFGRRP